MADIEKQIEELNRIADTAEESEWSRRTVAITDLLTEEQVLVCQKAGERLSGSELTDWILKNVIEPNMSAINEKLDFIMRSRGLDSQSENDPRYMAYAVTYFVERMKQLR